MELETDEKGIVTFLPIMNWAVTIVMDKTTLSIVSLTISTYLSDPSDAVNVNVQFARLPNGGPFHAATEVINGVSKQLTIEIQNIDYHHM